VTRPEIVAVTCLLLAVACQSEEATRDAQVFAEDALSLVPPAGWQVKHQKDTLVFVGGLPDDDARPVIAVRSVPISGWSEPRTAENVAPSVKTVLEALPGAEVNGPTAIDHPAYRALAFDVVFAPRSKHGARYQRRHVVLEAHGHLYHAFLTAPEGQLATNLPEFDRLLASLREEA
jgi:hypothetical protein